MLSRVVAPFAWLRPRAAASWSHRSVRWTVGAVLVAGLVVAGGWTAQYAWLIHGLNRGVGGTMFYDADGRPWFPLDEQRRDVPLERMSVFLKDAVIAVEDHRFYLHPGIDPVAVARAVVFNATQAEGQQGGSTITQQLARTLYLSTARTYGRKVKEAALSGLLELLLSKREILELYLNRVYLSGGVYGVESMAQRMLGKPASDVTLAEAAMIAGIIRAPATYSPWTHPEAARERSHVVLARMREEGKITAAQEQAARGERIRILPPPRVTSARHGYAKEFLRQQFRDVYGGDNPPGWIVHTTFVPSVQDAAEAAVRDGLRRLGVPGLEAALVAIDPSTGNLLAMVGGSDFAATPFNRATRSRRQPGSAFKPFVFAAGLERGLSPVSTLEGLRAVAVSAPEGVWIPRDEQARGADAMTLREALQESSNAAAVLLQQRVGTRPVVRLAAKLGVEDQPEVPSLSLGSGLVSPLALTAAYGVFPALGSYARPRGMVSVVSATGDRLHQVHVEREAVLPDTVAYQMVSMLQGVVDHGTASSVRALGVRGALGGKTGTTSDYRDAWFVGFSSAVVAGVWVGFDQPHAIRDGATGARVALPIWADFMRRTAQRLPSGPIAPPAGLRQAELCRLSHQRPVEGCDVYVEYFKDGDEMPSALCPIHPGTLRQRAARLVDGVVGSILRGLGLGR